MTLVCLSPNGVDAYRLAQPPDVLLVATLKGIFRLIRGAHGRSWNIASQALPDLHVSSLLRDPGSGLLFAGVYGGGLYRSRDDGLTWDRATQGLEHDHVFSLSCGAGAGATELYAGTEPAHLYRSRNLGDTWEDCPALGCVPGNERWNSRPVHVRHVACDARDSRRLYVCVAKAAVLKSEDGGQHFRELECHVGSYKLHEDAHRIVFNACNPDEIILEGTAGIARSVDRGETWEGLLKSALPMAYPDCVHYSPEEQGVLYMAGAGTTPEAWRQTGDAKAAIGRSRDGGRTWSQLRGGLPRKLAGNIEAVTMNIWCGGFGFCIGTTDGQVFWSVDKGETWTLITDALPPISAWGHHRDLANGRAWMQHLYAAAARSC